MTLDISSLTRTGDFINLTETSGRVNLTFGNLLDRVGNDLKILKKEVDAISTGLSFTRGNLTGPINGNLGAVNSLLNNVDAYLKVWKKVSNFKRIMIYAINHIMYDDDEITYTESNPQFSATYVASTITTSLNEGLFYEIYTALAAATDLTDIEAQLTEADIAGDIVDAVVLSDLETVIDAEVAGINANVALVSLAAVEYSTFITSDFIDALTIMESTLYDRDIDTIYETLIGLVADADDSVYNYNNSTGVDQAAYLSQAMTDFTNLYTQIGVFNSIANTFSDELTQILLDRESIKYDLIETAINVSSSIDTLKLDIIESVELIDETLNVVRNIFITRINALGTLPS